MLAITYAKQEKLLVKFPKMERYFRLLHQRAHAASQSRIMGLYALSREEAYRRFAKLYPEFVNRVPQYLLASFLGFTPEYLSEIKGQKTFLNRFKIFDGFGTSFELSNKTNTAMQQRLNIEKAHPEAYKAMYNLSAVINKSDLTPIQKELIKLRASQINSCAFCLNMHNADALKLGETQQRLFVLSAWRETTLFHPKKRLCWRSLKRLR